MNGSPAPRPGFAAIHPSPQELALPSPTLISFDESGFTGPNMLGDDQPVFAYAAVELSAEEAAELIAEIRDGRKPVIQAAELKASSLKRRGDWPQIADLVLKRMEGRYSFLVANKRLALAGKAFEYLMEPVLEDNNGIFYAAGLHRLVAGAVYRSFETVGGPAEDIARQFERFMRTFDPGDAPAVFDAAGEVPADARVLRELLRFARGYAETIKARNQHLRDDAETSKWVLDLTSTSLMSLLINGFGPKHRQLEVLCDESKPLQGIAPEFDAFIDNDADFPLHGGNRMVLGRLNLSGPIRFGQSHDNPTLQIADLIAGLAAQLYGRNPPEDLIGFKPQLDRHLHEDHILPETAGDSQMSEVQKEANMIVLRHLAARAELKADPLKNIRNVYAKAFKTANSLEHRLRTGRRK